MLGTTRTSVSDVKRQALAALDIQRGRVLPEAGDGNGEDSEIAMIDVPETRQQSLHS